MIENSPRLDAFEEGLPEDLPPAQDRQRRRRIVMLVLGALVLVLGLVNVLQSDTVAALRNTGTITGTVVDEAGVPVTGAEVAIPGTGLETVTDPQGDFQLDGVPAGSQAVLVAYAYVGREIHTTVPAGGVTSLGEVNVVTEVGPNGRAVWR